MIDTKPSTSGNNATRRTGWARWAIRSAFLLVGVGLAVGLWCLYDGISASVHAERGLHATKLTIQAAEAYVKKHEGAWPRSWAELEQSDSKVKEAYEWTEGAGNVGKFVFVDFGADPNRLARQTEREFEAIKPVGPF